MRSDYCILIVDDVPSIRDILTSLLTCEGYSVETAENGLEALKHVERLTPDLILLDINMPVLDGREFIHELTRRRVPVPVVTMTAEPFDESIQSEALVVDTLEKPLEFDSVLNVVARICTA